MTKNIIFHTTIERPLWEGWVLHNLQQYFSWKFWTDPFSEYENDVNGQNRRQHNWELSIWVILPSKLKLIVTIPLQEYFSHFCLLSLRNLVTKSLSLGLVLKWRWFITKSKLNVKLFPTFPEHLSHFCVLSRRKFLPDIWWQRPSSWVCSCHWEEFVSTHTSLDQLWFIHEDCLIIFFQEPLFQIFFPLFWEQKCSIVEINKFRSLKSWML